MADRSPGLRRTVVVKVGSSTLVDEAGRPRLPVFERLAGECAELVTAGMPVVVVSSGAVALGLGELGKTIRPRALGDLQAASALGQTLLQLHWQGAFAGRGLHAGQVLLTEADIHRRSSYVNARRTLRRLMSWNVVPVVNENDSTATDEITFGDNDALAAHVALMLQARLLVLLTDIDGVYDRDPSSADARLIPEILDAAQVEAVAESAPARSGWGSGGIAAKLRSAQVAGSGGVEAVIASGLTAGAITEAAAGRGPGTRFPAASALPSAYKLWLKLRNARARTADGGRRRPAGGVRAGHEPAPGGPGDRVDGSFGAGDAVELVGPDGGAVRGRRQPLRRGRTGPGRRPPRPARGRSPRRSGAPVSATLQPAERARRRPPAGRDVHGRPRRGPRADRPRPRAARRRDPGRKRRSMPSAAAGERPAIRDRLALDPGRVADLAEAVRAVARLTDPVGQTIREFTAPSGIRIRKLRVPARASCSWCTRPART